MARIEKYIASQPLNPDATGMPNTHVKNFMADALQGLGGAISGLAGAFAAKEEQKENFKAEDGYRRLQLQLGNELENRALNMPADGEGFHASFIKDVYTPARDQFLQSLPPRLRERYGTLLGDAGSDTEKWSIASATKERDQLYKWYDTSLKAGQEQLAVAISMDPEGYDDFLQQGYRDIDASGLPTAVKEEHKRNWERMAQISHMEKMLQTPDGAARVMRELGVNPAMLSPVTQESMLVYALIQQESSGNPNALSRKGAVGLMQVMPDTAYDIAKQLKDPNFPKGNPEQASVRAAITSYLSDPETNMRYGKHYLREQIRTFVPKGGLKAALIAYHSGPRAAQRWIDSGFDDGVLGPEGRAYYDKVMARLPTGPEQAPKGNPQAVTIEWGDVGKTTRDSVRGEAGVKPELTNRLKTAFAAVGLDKIKITSGHRGPEDNKAGGGASGSQHLHGNAVDIDVSHMSHADRATLIRSLSANGITGLGIGNNIIHADLGKRRAWGYATSSGGGKVPDWAASAIAEHMEGRARAPSGTGVGGRYNSLPYADRQRYIARADQQLAATYTARNQSVVAERIEVQRLIRNELASLEDTGTSTGLVDDYTASTVLTEAQLADYYEKREQAVAAFTAKDGMATMNEEEMAIRLNEYVPRAGSPTYERDKYVYEAVERESRRIASLRARDPFSAAMAYPDVKAAWEAINLDEPDPRAVQAFIEKTLERQAEFNIKPGSEAYVPRQWAMTIGQRISSIPELAGRNASVVSAGIVKLYDDLFEVFGDYTDEVILQALATYKGIGKNTGALIAGMMESIAAGGDPIGRERDKLERAMEQDAMEAVSDVTMWQRVTAFFRGEPPETQPADPGVAESQGANHSVNVERAMNAIVGYDTIGPEEEAAIIARYGQTAYDEAKRRLEGK